MFAKRTIRDLDIAGKRALVRVDFNVPLDEQDQVRDDTRIRAAIPTLEFLAAARAKIILVTHLGRPKGFDEKLRVDPVARKLGELIGRPVCKSETTTGPEVKRAADALRSGEVLLLENVRFEGGEKQNDREFAKELASLADVYVNDAFGVCHRQHASTYGVTEFLPAAAGFLLEKEVKTLSGLLENPAHPFLVILGGNKVSDKIGVIKKFLKVVDGLLTGGGMCFTFFKAQGLSVGHSLVQDEMLETCEQLLGKVSNNGWHFYLPSDIVIAKEVARTSAARVVPAREMPECWMGLDIGPRTIEAYVKALANAKTIFWNGPLGVFEMEAFSAGTRRIAEAVANSQATTIVGGGDTDAALRQYGLEDKISFISTGGGASLKMLEGQVLPGVEALDDLEVRQ